MQWVDPGSCLSLASVRSLTTVQVSRFLGSFIAKKPCHADMCLSMTRLTFCQCRRHTQHQTLVSSEGLSTASTFSISPELLYPFPPPLGLLLCTTPLSSSWSLVFILSCSSSHCLGLSSHCCRLASRNSTWQRPQAHHDIRVDA